LIVARFVFRLPDVGEGITEAEIAAWHVQLGSRVEEDDMLVDIMTDKATVDITSPVSGVVAVIHGAVGQLMAVGAPLVELDTSGEGQSPDVSRADEEAVVPRPPPSETSKPLAKQAPTAGAPLAPAVAKSSAPAVAMPSERTVIVDVVPKRPLSAAALASPFVRRRAFELGIPLQFVPGSAAEGRITEKDLESYIETAANPPIAAGVGAKRTGTKETRLIGLRRVIAERMATAARRIPHFGYVEEFDMTELEALRTALNVERSADQPKLTLLPFFMRAIAVLIPQFPYCNAHFDDEAGVLRTHEGVHMGIATQTSAGLMVPVVRHCESLDLWQCAREMSRVTEAAREGKAPRELLQGSTITLTSLGPLGGLSATPVINHPEVAIIAPNKLSERIRVRDAAPVVRTVMNVSSAFDHRIIDGHDAARFIKALRALLERPARLFLPAS
jgi:2-oxoisovalerate dehydrogenase E2 component (dihydrolipoyl transacylase)